LAGKKGNLKGAGLMQVKKHEKVLPRKNNSQPERGFKNFSIQTARNKQKQIPHESIVQHSKNPILTSHIS